MALGPITVTGTLTAVASDQQFTDASRTEAADYFAYGTIRFTSGANAGLKPLEIRQHMAGGVIQTFEPFYYVPVVGDAYEMIPGCRKRLSDCKDKWNNVVNFGGFPYAPVGSSYAEIGTK